MKKSKLMKALLVFGMSVVTATSIVGFTACGHEHIDSDSDGVCDECGIEMPDSGNEGGGNEGGGNEGGGNEGGGNEGGGNEGGGNEGGGEEQTKDPVLVNFKDLTGNLSDGDAIGTDTGITAVGTITVEANTKKSKYGGADVEFTNRAKLDASTVTSRGLKVNVTQNATVIVYAYSGTSGTEKSLELYDANKAKIADSTQSIGNGQNDILGVAMYEVTANTDYYIFAAEKTVNLYGVAVVYGALNETWGEEIPATSGDCTNKGNIAYHVSNYGRYYTTDASTIVYGGSVITPALGHQYTTPVTLTENLPTETATATYTAHCTRPGCIVEGGTAEFTKDIILPNLTDNRYNRTATGASEGNNIYTITLDDIVFTFETTAVVADTYVASIDFKALSGTETTAPAVDATYGTTWFALTTKGTSKWVSGSGMSTKSAVWTITVEQASTLSIKYYSTSSGRTFTIKKDNVDYIDTDVEGANGTYEANVATDKTVVINLTEGTYTITFDANEHKIESVSCNKK